MKDFIIPVNPRELVQSSNSSDDEYRVSEDILLNIDEINPESLLSSIKTLLCIKNFSIYDNFDELFQLIILDSNRHVLQAWVQLYSSFKKFIQNEAVSNQESSNDKRFTNEFKMYIYLLTELTKLARAQITQQAPATPNITPRRRKTTKTIKSTVKSSTKNSSNLDREKYLYSYIEYLNLIESNLLQKSKILSFLDDDSCILYSTELIIIIEDATSPKPLIETSSKIQFVIKCVSGRKGMNSVH